MASTPATLLPVVLVGLFLSTSLLAHDESGEFSCERKFASSASVSAPYFPGAITIDGDAEDWKEVPGQDFDLRPALDPDGDVYPGGRITIKAAHDGRDLYFLLQIPGSYQYKSGEHHSCPSIALMFKIGDSATYHNMGGCSDRDTCSNITCQGHEVDIMHFQIGNAIPGRKYGANILDNVNGTGKDWIGSLNDLYSWNPHCRHYDGVGSDGMQNGFGQNDWNGVWMHSSIKRGSGLVSSDSPFSSPSNPGTYIFEFSRPLQTADLFQQDVQFSIGHVYRFAAGFWYPLDDKPWGGFAHYSANCDWIPLQIMRASLQPGNKTIASSLISLSFAFAVLSLCASVTIGWWIKKQRDNNKVAFTQLDGL